MDQLIWFLAVLIGVTIIVGGATIARYMDEEDE